MAAPPSVRDLPSELGAETPETRIAGNVADDWFRDAIDNKMADTLLDPGSKIFQYLRPTQVRLLFERHASGRQDNHKILFSLVLFEQWLRTHEDAMVAANCGGVKVIQ